MNKKIMLIGLCILILLNGCGEFTHKEYYKCCIENDNAFICVNVTNPSEITFTNISGDVRFEGCWKPLKY